MIHAQPGLSFSGLRKATGWGHGTTHYHVKRLLKAGLVKAYDYRNSVRYYENHGRHTHDWHQLAALQKPELRILHGAIAAAPATTQAGIIRTMADKGWKRSTTRYYLGILSEAGLVKVERRALALAYTALQVPR